MTRPKDFDMWPEEKKEEYRKTQRAYHKDFQAEWRRKNPEKAARSKQTSYQKDPEKWRAWGRAYYARNKEKSRKTSAAWRAKNLEKVTQQNRDYQHSSSTVFHAAIKSMKVSDRRSGRVFDLSVTDLEGLWCAQKGLCADTGLQMRRESRYHKDLERVSVDRIDNTKGHTIDNVRLVCWFVNQGRSETTIDEWRATLARLRQTLLSSIW